MLTSFRPGLQAITSDFKAHGQPSSLRTFLPHRGGEEMSVIERNTFSHVENQVTMETDTTSVANEAAILKVNRDTRSVFETDTLRQNRVPNDSLQQMTCSEGYLQPVDNNNKASPRLRDRKVQTLQPRPQPRLKMRRRKTTDARTNNPPDEIANERHCACAKPADQSNHVNPQTGTFYEVRGYQNDRSQMKPYQNTTSQSCSFQPPKSGESPYTRVHNNTNWELPPGHLSLFERIGGGSFGQVWKGAACDVIGAKGWSVVAVKMLKGKYKDHCTDKLLIIIANTRSPAQRN